MRDAPSPATTVNISSMTVRGPGLSAGHGRALAQAVGIALARAVPDGGSVDRLTVRVPASVLTPAGAVDHAALDAAVRRQLGGRDA